MWWLFWKKRKKKPIEYVDPPRTGLEDAIRGMRSEVKSATEFMIEQESELTKLRLLNQYWHANGPIRYKLVSTDFDSVWVHEPMSYLDELLNGEHGYHRDYGYGDEPACDMPNGGECTCGRSDALLAARAELAALRRRAEDAEMIAKALSAGISTARSHFGRLSAQRSDDGLWAWTLRMDTKIGETMRFLYLTNDPATGLPILTDEARKELKKEN